MSAKRLKYLCLVAPVLLAACGDDYVQIRTTEIAPYGNARTAGSTIAYVRASLLPEKNLEFKKVTDTVTTTETSPVMFHTDTDKNLLRELERDLEKIFNAKQKK